MTFQQSPAGVEGVNTEGDSGGRIFGQRSSDCSLQGDAGCGSRWFMLPTAKDREWWSWLSQITSVVTVSSQDFPAGGVAKTLFCQCRGLRLDPWSGN